jgi:hypothetical protein
MQGDRLKHDGAEVNAKGLGEVVAFPVARRRQIVRLSAIGILSITDDAGRAVYWEHLKARLASELRSYGISEDDLYRCLLEFRQAVAEAMSAEECAAAGRIRP